METNAEKTIHRNSLISLLIVVGISGTLGASVVALSYREYRVVAAERTQLTQESERLLKVTAVARRANQALNNLKRASAEAESQIPEFMNFEQFYESITDHAARHNVVLRHLKPGDGVEGGLYASLPVVIEAEARFEDFHAFLFAWGQSDRIVKLEHLAIRGAGGAGNCSIDMVLRLYSKRLGGSKHG